MLLCNADSPNNSRTSPTVQNHAVPPSADPMQTEAYEPVKKVHLLAHGTLVGVTRGLVVMGVWDEARHNPQHSEGLNLQVCGVSPTLGLI